MSSTWDAALDNSLFHLAEHAAAEGVSLDLSDKMLALARAEWSHPTD